jgi:N-acetylglutamate synthase-like GNAT family acetyltransferase
MNDMYDLLILRHKYQNYIGIQILYVNPPRMRTLYEFFYGYVYVFNHDVGTYGCIDINPFLIRLTHLFNSLSVTPHRSSRAISSHFFCQHESQAK